MTFKIMLRSHILKKETLAAIVTLLCVFYLTAQRIIKEGTVSLHTSRKEETPCSFMLDF